MHSCDVNMLTFALHKVLQAAASTQQLKYGLRESDVRYQASINLDDRNEDSWQWEKSWSLRLRTPNQQVQG